MTPRRTCTGSLVEAEPGTQSSAAMAITTPVAVGGGVGWGGSFSSLGT